MLNGFVLKGNTVERPLVNVAQGNAGQRICYAMKRHYLAILVSVGVHILLAFLLFFIAEKQPPKQVQIAKKAIKSYLYKMPSKPVIVEPVVVKKVLEEVKVKEKVKIKKRPEVLQEKKPKSDAPKTVPSLSKAKFSKKAKQSTKVQKTMQATFSAHKQLNSLRKSINKKMVADELAELQKFRSPSVMHGEQIPVPHSTKQLTPEQEREKKTTRMSDDISITKYDNGLCTIERKQFIGSPIEGSTSAFACGESKFDKSFREHMKKVRDKLIPKQ